MHTTILGSTLIYRCPILTDPRLTRRQCELLTVQHIVQHIFGTDAVISHLPSGAPFILGNDSNISVSHCATEAVVAVNHDRKIGVDIELLRPTLSRVASRYLSDKELPVYGVQPHSLLKAWTLKEAIYKAAGVSPLPLHDIHLPIDDHSREAYTPHSRFAIYSFPEKDICISVAEKL